MRNEEFRETRARVFDLYKSGAGSARQKFLIPNFYFLIIFDFTKSP